MTPTHQTKFGHGNGNCLMACVASILDRPLDAIPDFNESGFWYGALYKWCLKENIGLITLSPKDLEQSICCNAWCILIFSVVETNDETHAVVGKCRRIEVGDVDARDETAWKWETTLEFDPNPRGIKIKSLEHVIFLLQHQ